MKLSVKQRKKLAASKFALPKVRKYPIEDVGHAKAALSRASQMAKKGVLSKADEEKIKTKAHKVLNGGKSKTRKK